MSGNSKPPQLHTFKSEGFEIKAAIAEHKVLLRQAHLEIERLEANLRQAVSQRDDTIETILRLKSYLSPIRTLSSDILSQIFQYYAQEKAASPEILLRVCRFWHEAALDPRVWATLHFTSEMASKSSQWTAIFHRRILRSKCTALKIHIDAESWADEGRMKDLSILYTRFTDLVAETLLDRLHRCKTLYLSCKALGKTQRERLCHLILGSDMPALRHAELHWAVYTSSAFPATQNLQLKLRDCRLKELVDPTAITSITFLYPSPTEWFGSSLDKFINLKHLAIRTILVDWRSPNSILPQLESVQVLYPAALLCLEDVRCPALRRWITCTDFFVRGSLDHLMAGANIVRGCEDVRIAQGRLKNEVDFALVASLVPETRVLELANEWIPELVRAMEEDTDLFSCLEVLKAIKDGETNEECVMFPSRK